MAFKPTQTKHTQTVMTVKTVRSVRTVTTVTTVRTVRTVRTILCCNESVCLLQRATRDPAFCMSTSCEA